MRNFLGSTSRTVQVGLMLGAGLFLVACGGEDATPRDRFPDNPQTPEDVEFHDQLGVDLSTATRLDSGIYVQVLAEGEGDPVEAGDRVTFHYTGWLSDGRKFDSSRDRGEPSTFAVGVGSLIDGWDIAIPGMQVGDRHLLIIPSDLAYGPQGSRGVIPPNAVLVFDVEVIAIPE